MGKRKHSNRQRLMDLIEAEGSVSIYAAMAILKVTRHQLEGAIAYARSQLPSTMALRRQDDVLRLELTPAHAQYGKAPQRQQEEHPRGAVEAISYDDVREWT